MLKLKYFFALVAIVTGFASCSKEYSYEGGYTNAVFTLPGVPDPCSGAVIGGVYIKGIALSNLNTAAVSVSVDSIGTYDIATGTVNGISFSTAGTFVTTGTKTVFLTGTGTPTATGNFGFTIMPNGCSFAVNFIANNSNGGNNNAAEEYLTCALDGSNSTFNSNVGISSINASGLSSITINGIDSTSNASFEITLGNKGLITTGAYNLVTATNITPMFCTIVYIDSNNNSWGSALSGQSGAFQITVTGKSSSSIQGMFSGTLYSNGGTGNVAKVVTNGQFSAAIP